MTAENIQIQVSEHNLIEVSTWHEGSLNLKFMAKPTPDSDWQFNGGLLLSKGSARALAVTLLEKAGSTNILMKKFRPAHQ